MPRGMRLKTLSDVRRFAARIANELYRDKMPEGKARALTYLAATLKDILKESDLEDRLAALEEKIGKETRW